MSKLLDQFSRYGNVVVLGDFNLVPDDIALSSLIMIMVNISIGFKSLKSWV